MRKRIFIVIGLLIVFRFLAHVPIPLAEPTQLRQLLNSLFDSQQLLGFLDLISGGALSNFSIMLMGLGPYINASIIMQLLSKAIPRLEAINKEGEQGRRKINQYTRILALPLAVMQSIGLIFLIRQQATAVSGVDITAGADITQWILMVATLTGGSMLLMWIGELMSEQGVGNGISLLIFAGIVSQLPSIVGTLINSVVGAGAQFTLFGRFVIPVNGRGALFVLGLTILSLIMVYLVVKLNEAQRILTVSYAKRVRGNRAYGGVDTVLPIKLITAGVIPVIFASAFLAIPAFLGQLLINANSESLVTLGQNLIDWFSLPGSTEASAQSVNWIYNGVYFGLVVLFTYFYTSIMFDSKEIAENLQKQGGFIAGIRPGIQTENYLRRVVTRLTLFGSISLGLLAISPFLIDAVVIALNLSATPISTQLSLGGTGLLIVVSVALETLRQIESRSMMISYDTPE
jgi:preprotein translocase subunit SecY